MNQAFVAPEDADFTKSWNLHNAFDLGVGIFGDRKCPLETAHFTETLALYTIILLVLEYESPTRDIFNDCARDKFIGVKHQPLLLQ